MACSAYRESPVFVLSLTSSYHLKSPSPPTLRKLPLGEGLTAPIFKTLSPQYKPRASEEM